MYAIVQIGGRQYRAIPGTRVVVDRLEVEPGDEVQLQDVRMVVAEAGDREPTAVGTPTVDGVTVTATALGHLRGEKVLVFKYKPKKRYRRQRGFRAELTELRIDAVGAVPRRAAKAKDAEEAPAGTEDVEVAAAVTPKRPRASRPPAKRAAKAVDKESEVEEPGDGA